MPFFILGSLRLLDGSLRKSPSLVRHAGGESERGPVGACPPRAGQLSLKSALFWYSPRTEPAMLRLGQLWLLFFGLLLSSLAAAGMEETGERTPDVGQGLLA